MKRLAWIGFILFVFFSLTFLLFQAGGWMDEDNLARWLRDGLKERGLEAVTGPLIALLLLVDLALPVPSSVVMTLAGFFQGMWLGFLFNFIGAMGAALAGFWICRRYGHRGFQAVIGSQESARVEEFFQRYGAWAIVLSRSVPMLTEVVSCLAGLSQMSYRRFTALTTLGTLPLCLVYAWAGETAGGRVPLFWLVLLCFVLPAVGYAAFRLATWRRDTVLPVDAKGGPAQAETRSRPAGSRDDGPSGTGSGLDTESGTFFRRPSASSILILVGLALCPGLVRTLAAQDDEEERQDPGLPEIHDTVTVNARPAQLPGAAVSVIEAAEIDASGARSVAQVLKSVPGVHVLSNGTRGGSSVAYVRGGDPNFTLVYLDGIPLNDPTDQIGGIYNLEGIPASAIGRIEVVRGPLSSYFGSQALAGVIYLTTRRGSDVAVRASDHPASTTSPSGGSAASPGARPASARGSFRVSAQIEGGDASLRRAQAALGGTSGNADYFFSVLGEGEEGRIADDDYQAVNLQAGLGWQGNRTSLRLNARGSLWEADDYSDSSGGPLFGSGQVRHSENEEWSLAADLQMRPGTHFQHNIAGGLYRHGLDRFTPAVGFSVPPVLEDTTFTRVRLGWRGDWHMAEDFDLSLGAELDHEDADAETFLLLPPQFGGRVDGSYRDQRTSGGGYAALHFNRGPWQVEAGARIDKPTDFDSVFSPRASFSYSLGPRTTRLRGSIGRAFKLPSFFALSSPDALGGNPSLLEERSWGGDIGFDHLFPQPSLLVGGAYFHNRFENLIDFDFDQFLHVNRTRVRTQGVEIYAEWKPDPRWKVRADATFTESDDLNSLQPLLHRPGQTGGLSFDLTPHPRLSLFLQGRWVGANLDRQIPVPERNRVDGYAAVDLSATWHLTRRLHLRGHLENLTDNDYQTFIGFPAPGLSARVSLAVSSP
ncbi:MAG TPA: TonB-dependent receptor [Acidobacteriota bacterium]|nr:TonB-dependent receptor [Acidobacteriota bacterium]